MILNFMIEPIKIDMFVYDNDKKLDEFFRTELEDIFFSCNLHLSSVQCISNSYIDFNTIFKWKNSRKRPYLWFSEIKTKVNIFPCRVWSQSLSNQVFSVNWRENSSHFSGRSVPNWKIIPPQYNFTATKNRVRSGSHY